MLKICLTIHQRVIWVFLFVLQPVDFFNKLYFYPYFIGQVFLWLWITQHFENGATFGITDYLCKTNPSLKSYKYFAYISYLTSDRDLYDCDRFPGEIRADTGRAYFQRCSEHVIYIFQQLTLSATIKNFRDYRAVYSSQSCKIRLRIQDYYA